MFQHHKNIQHAVIELPPAACDSRKTSKSLNILPSSSSIHSTKSASSMPKQRIKPLFHHRVIPPQAPRTELAIHMQPHLHSSLNEALYGSPHGFGERRVKLEMTSDQSGIVICMRVVCSYEANVLILTAVGIYGSDWVGLCRLVAEEGVVWVKFELVGGVGEWRGGITRAAGEGLGDIRGRMGGENTGDDVAVRFSWTDDDGDGFRKSVKRGVEWVKERFR
ncbi:hypothetical protein P153DRAFT_177553 [Dothidotthia symphoricarpi CBS 119687]|uniref:Uncharacterized protein n=1 Tax=Dothidotthia symphoricarpi CBS 119687 TaxID=1392245 RepID=A0A6A6AN35_9PLEO|nr:uncharacterized protein P153DRAFT_177553 [Dothidotthia symphoricarpi CBS 119687]KAF2132976.1 hypothetical protein P153DRAFT_177553 [Dothidotthia symphoricarpi CBS 119687]